MIASDNIRVLGDLDLPGGGQIVVVGHYAYIGHMNPPHGTTIVDVSDPRKPVVVSQLQMELPYSHSHKVRVAGDIMVTNVERERRNFFRNGERLPALRTSLAAKLNREATDAELAAELHVAPSDIPKLDEARVHGYQQGGFKIWDISDRTRPREITYARTFGAGVHRFDMDENYAYLSTEMEGYVGNILVIYDIRNPEKPEEVSRWWLPGQHLAGGETPTWRGAQCRLHHALRVGNELWAAVWNAGFRVIDISDIRQPKTIAAHNYHPPEPEPTHTTLPIPTLCNGRRIALAVDEEHGYQYGRGHAKLWAFDVTDYSDIRALSYFQLEESHSPWGAKGRFGAHQFQEHFVDTRAYTAWFAGGLRIVEMADPLNPTEVGFYIPDPKPGCKTPQSNDVDVDSRGLVYLLDRNCGLQILEFNA
jgi:hypothetical protein